MAGIFSSQAPGPTGSAVTPQRPSQEVSGLGTALSIGSSFIPSQQQVAAQKAAGQKAQMDVSTTEFTQGQLAISDAVASGRMSSSEGRRRMRVNFSKAIANNPSALEGLTKAQKDIMATSGLGKVVQEGTEEEQSFFRLRDEAMSAGYIPSGASEEQARAGIQRWQEFNRNQDILAQQQAELTYRRGQIGMQSDRIGLARAELGLSTDRVQHQSAILSLQEKKTKKRVQDALVGMSSAWTPKMRGDGNDIQERLDRGEITREQAVAAWDNNWESVQQIATQAGANAGGEFLSTLLSPAQMIYNNRRAQLTGEVSKEIAENRNDIAIALSQEDILSSPQMRRIVGVSKLLPNSDLSTLSATSSFVSKYIGAATSDDTSPTNFMSNDPDDQEGVDSAVRIFKDNIKALDTGTAQDPEQTDIQLETNIRKMLRGVDAFGYATDSPEQYNKVVDFLASPEYGSYVSKKGASFSRQEADSARAMIEQQYMDQVLPLVEEEWNNSKTTTSALPSSGVLGTSARSEATDSVIEPMFSGGGVVFRAARGVNNPRVAAKAKELNRRVSPVVNRIIRMSAHLEGNTDYQAQYENTFSQLFTNGGDEESSE